MMLLRRRVVFAALMVLLIAAMAGGIALWRPAEAVNDPYQEQLVRWTVPAIAQDRTFFGLGSFVYREQWEGPAQEFAGPVLLTVANADAPVRFVFSGPVTVAPAGQDEIGLDQVASPAASASPALTGSVTGTEQMLAPGDMAALPAGTSFRVATGEGEVVRLSAIAILPGTPPATPGIEQAEWRAWGFVTPAPDTPLTVTASILNLTGGETYTFRRDHGPALYFVEGLTDGVQPIALTVTQGQGALMRVAEFAPYLLTSPVTYTAPQTPTTRNQERPFDARSGAFLPAGTSARLRNRGLVDGTDVLIVTFDGPHVITPTATVAAPTPSPTRPGGTATRASGDGST